VAPAGPSHVAEGPRLECPPALIPEIRRLGEPELVGVTAKRQPGVRPQNQLPKCLLSAHKVLENAL